MFEPGDKIEDVEIVARLRAGGMAALYLGRRAGAHGFSKQIAVKVVHGHLSNDEAFVTMFVDEARLSARIDHPNVVRVEALKEHKGSYCLLMEFVHGCSLSQLMSVLKKRKTRFSPELAVAVAIRVADGLHAAHELINPDGTPAGVVHRDVSPANVLIGYRGDVKLIDFGIAKASQRMHQTEAAGLKGKIAYMSPEQAFGRDIDRRTDVYALGIMLWEMLAMRRLFAADNDLRLLDMVRDPKVLPPRALVPDLSPELEKVILEALSPNPNGRPATARDLRYRLLNAMPSAATVDPLQISAVVCDVMADKIQADREMLSLSSFNSMLTPSHQDSVTLSRLLRPVHTGVDIGAELGGDAGVLASGLPTPAARAEPPTVLPQHGFSEPAPRRSILPIFLGTAAVLGMLFGGSAAAGFALLGAEDAAMTATEIEAQGVNTAATEPADPEASAVDSTPSAPGAVEAEPSVASTDTGSSSRVADPATPENPPVGDPVANPAATEVRAEPASARTVRTRRRGRVRRGQGRAAASAPEVTPAAAPEPAPSRGGRSRGSGGSGLAGEARF